MAKKKKKIKHQEDEYSQPRELNISLPLIWGPDDIRHIIDDGYQTIREDIEHKIAHRFPEVHAAASKIPGPLNPRTRAPLMDISETDRDLIIIFEIPGIAKEDIEIEVTEDVLVIEAQRSEDDEEMKFLKRERLYTSWSRTVILPEEVDPNRTRAKLTDGILEVKIQKKNPSKETRAHKVKIE